jgi:hypothetical protein
MTNAYLIIVNFQASHLLVMNATYKTKSITLQSLLGGLQ